MATVVRTSVRPIITAVRDRLVAKTGLGRHLVKPAARADVPDYPGDRHLLLVPDGPTPLKEWQDGAGRVATVALRPLLVVVRVRLTQDPSDSDERYLLSDEGLLALEEKALDALQMYLPTDETGNALTIEPLHWLPSRGPAKQPQWLPSRRPVKMPSDPSWGQSVLAFSLLYMPPLDQADQ